MGLEHVKAGRNLHEATMKEVALWHLHGPFSEDQITITSHFGSDKWLFNPRFALYQGSEGNVQLMMGRDLL